MIAARNLCLFFCFGAVLFSAVCVRYFMSGYAAARQKRLLLQGRSAVLRSLLSGREGLPVDPSRGAVDHKSMPWNTGNSQFYVMAAAAEISRLADNCGVKVVSMRTSAPESSPGTVNLEAETIGGEKETRSFIYAVENSLFIFTINKARVDVSTGGGTQLKAGFCLSALKEIPEHLGGMLNEGEALSEIRSAVQRDDHFDEDKSIFFNGPGRSSDRRRTVRSQLENGVQRGLNGLKLTGIILGKEPVAFVEDSAAGKNYRIKPGQYINGFRLERVIKGRIFLLKGDSSYELSL